MSEALSPEDLLELNASKDLFRSNLFRLQLEELLSEIKVKQSQTTTTQNELHSLKETLESLPEYTFTEKYIRKLSPPLHNPPNEQRLAYTFAPPSNLQVIGSFLLQTICRPQTNVDLAIEMPKSCLIGSDASHCRYEDKRMLYLYHIAKKLQEIELYRDRVYFEPFRGDQHKPVLCIKPDPKKKKKRTKFLIKIHILVPDNIFKPSRLLPSRNNLQKEGDELLQGTPYRNNAILEDLLSVQHLTKLHAAISDCPALIDAILLFKVWLRQRELDSDGGMNGFLISMLMLYLLKKRQLNSQMSSYQLFRVTLNYLSTDEILKGISLSDEPAEQFSVFLESFSVVFLDHTGRLNLASRVTIGGINEIRYEAKLALQYLTESTTSGVQVLFLQRVSFRLKFDQIFHITVPSELLESSQELSDLNKDQSLIKEIQATLEIALCKRMPLIVCKFGSASSWKLGETPVTPNLISIGVLFDIRTAFNPLERGPSPEDTTASKAFRNLWKDKCELWQMNDGTIVDAVQWEIEDDYQHLIPKEQILYLLQIHFGISESQVHTAAGQIDPILFNFHNKTKQTPNPTAASLYLNQVFDEFEEMLHNLSELPLRIAEIHRSHPALSFTATTTPTPHPLLTQIGKSTQIPRFIEPIPLYLEFEENSQWPKDIQAIEALKAAFYVLLSRALSENYSVENIVTKQYLDVFTHGFVFRLSIYLPQEIQATEQFISIQTAKTLQIDQIEKSKHLKVVRGFNSLNSVYGKTVRLAKFWIHSQMLSPFFTEQTIELLVAYLFISPAPFSAPNSHLIGFVRFLYLLGNYNWETDPLIVDIHNELSVEKMNEINGRFKQLRKAGAKQSAMFIATPRDLHSSHWTKTDPSPMILQRTVALAQQCIQLIETSLLSEPTKWKEWKNLFCAPLVDFDVIIEVYQDIVPYGKQNNLYNGILQASGILQTTETSPDADRFLYQCNKFKNLDDAIPVSELLVGVHPIRNFYKELNAHFGDIAMFFHGEVGVNLIGVVWKPAAFLPQVIKPHTLQHSNPLPVEMQNEKKPFVIRDIFDIISDIKTIGKGIVADIHFIRGSEKL